MLFYILGALVLMLFFHCSLPDSSETVILFTSPGIGLLRLENFIFVNKKVLLPLSIFVNIHTS